MDKNWSIKYKLKNANNNMQTTLKSDVKRLKNETEVKYKNMRMNLISLILIKLV